jgi:hypothetical protein
MQVEKKKLASQITRTNTQNKLDFSLKKNRNKVDEKGGLFGAHNWDFCFAEILNLRMKTKLFFQI